MRQRACQGQGVRIPGCQRPRGHAVNNTAPCGTQMQRQTRTSPHRRRRRSGCPGGKIGQTPQWRTQRAASIVRSAPQKVACLVHSSKRHPDHATCRSSSSQVRNLENRVRSASSQQLRWERCLLLSPCPAVAGAQTWLFRRPRNKAARNDVDNPGRAKESVEPKI